MPTSPELEINPARSEAERLLVLHDYEVLDTEAEESFDALTRLAAYLCGTEAAFISLLDKQRQWLKSKVGITENEMPREISFCQHVIQSDDLYEINDASTHALYKDNPLVTGEANVRFYAGAPLITPSGHRLGSLCVIDTKPKVLSQEQREALQILAREVISHLEFRRQKKRAEQDNIRLRLYNMLFRHSTEMMCILDIKTGIFIEVNVAFQHVMGYPAHELIGHNLGDFLHPDDLEKVQNKIKTMPHFEPLELESRFYTKSKEIRWISWTATGQNGKWFATARDITDLRKTGSENIDLQNLLVSVLDNSPSGICALRCIRNSAREIIDFKWLMLNREVEKIVGQEARELIGQPVLPLLAPEDQTVFLSILSTVVQGQQALSHEHQFKIGNKNVWLNLVASHLDDGVVVVMNDISARKQVELKLQDQKAFYESILNAVPADLVVHDADHKYLYINPAAVKDAEVRQWLIGKSVYDYCTYRNLDMALAHERSAMLERAAEERRQLEWDEKKVLPTGETSYFNRRLNPVFAENGSLKYYIGYGLDISDLKKTEQELIAAKEQAEFSMQAKETFLSMMSHEIRTPLNAIIGMSHILLQESPNPDQIENLKILQFSGENLLVLINDILDFSKIEAGKISFEEIDFSLKDLINGIRQSFSFRADEKGIRLRTRLDADLPTIIVGDPVRLNQILMNLVSNAIKFTEKGSVTLDVTVEREQADEVEVIFTVTDTGIGIPADKIDAIFDSFTQANSNTTRKFGGTGLGLTITKRLVELQQGHIQVESTEGKGAAFSVKLVFRKSSQKTVTTSHHYLNTTENNLGHISLLLVEDNEVNQLIATKFLKKWGIQPDYAVNGAEAIEKIQQKTYDLVLMDLQMPVMDGYDATKAIRLLGNQYTNIPIIALTASAMLDVRDKVIQFGMNDYVTKPFNPNELYQKISRYAQAEDYETTMASSETSGRMEPNVPANALNLNPILELAGNDTVFFQELIAGYKQAFVRFPSEFEQVVLTNPDLGKYKFTVHKLKAAIDLIQATDLAAELEEAEYLVKNNATGQAAQKSVEQVKFLCGNILAALDQVSN